MSAVPYPVAARLVAAALDRAAEIACPVSVAVLDETRELVAFARQPGAPVFTAEVAKAKAFTARSLLTPTHETQKFTGPGGPFYGLESVGGGVVCTIPGGLPLSVDGEVVGAIGVSGGSAEQDLDVATHAAGAF
ncbi:heme-binding protein [Pseudonocardia sp. RS11V-5]|uniref:GlcG/HbpS family heme-binding protein n=1 Tax=Pseudonocardia terrae TaxID=2905831 RepID=UPI001E50FEB8|nr:heme-binding protein [Pseudonocardia terrae]MCE3551414.1 heme-binding protein [Pseudonocardia terrae]